MPDGDPAAEARVLAAGVRDGGQRLHGFQGPKAPGMDSKKSSVGASERDEFLRVAWRVMIAGEIYAERLVFLRTSAPPTPRWHPSTLGLDEESELFVRSHATWGRT